MPCVRVRVADEGVGIRAHHRQGNRAFFTTKEAQGNRARTVDGRWLRSPIGREPRRSTARLKRHAHRPRPSRERSARRARPGDHGRQDSWCRRRLMLIDDDDSFGVGWPNSFAISAPRSNDFAKDEARQIGPIRSVALRLSSSVTSRCQAQRGWKRCARSRRSRPRSNAVLMTGYRRRTAYRCTTFSIIRKPIDMQKLSAAFDRAKAGEDPPTHAAPSKLAMRAAGRS